MDRTRKSYLFAGLSVLFWATIPTAFKIALGELDVVSLLAISTSVSTIALLVIVVSTGKLQLIIRTTPGDLLKSALLGFINPFIYYIILLRAYTLLPGQVAQPLNMIWPIILVFLSVPLLGQKIPARSFLALFISFAGVYIISSQGRPLHPGNSDTTGVVLATGSSFFWAVYFILNVRDRRDEAVKLFTNFLFATIYIIITLKVTRNSMEGVSLKGLLSAVYIGLFEMGITFFFWLRALVYLAPFISLVLLYFIVKEPVYYTTPAGLVLIIGGIYVQNRKTKPAN